MSIIVSALLLGSAVIATVPPAASCDRDDGCQRAATARVATGVTRSIRRVIPAQAPRELLRARDGLFYIDATVNGASVRFLVDTGATTVILTAADARRAGISAASSRAGATADTANGGASMSWVTLDHVDVAGTTARSLRAAVAGEGLSVSLLGQSWLSQLESVTIRGDRMTLR